MTVRIRALVYCAVLLFSGPVRSMSRPADKPTDVESLLAACEHAMSGWQDYQVKGDTESKGKHSLFKVCYKSPNLVRVDAKEGQVSVQPDGSIRGRLGHGIFGRISRGISRTDKRLQDDEGIPFYDSDLPALIARIRQRIKGGAKASMEEKPDGYELEISSGMTKWKYTLDKMGFFLKEDSRWVGDKQVEVTHYTDFHANTGLTVNFFKF